MFFLQEYGECLSDPDQFAEDFYDRLDQIGETLNTESGPAGSLFDPAELEEFSNDDDLVGMSALSRLNHATRKKLLVQVCCSFFGGHVFNYKYGIISVRFLGNVYPNQSQL